MDFGIECSTRESVEENDVNNGRNNGYCSDEKDKLRSGGGHSGLVYVESRESGNSSGSTKKGYGLKKWRRIRRDVVKGGGAEVDSEKVVLKRGLPGSVIGDPGKSSQFLSEVKQGIEDLVGSVNAVKSVGVSDGFGVQGLSSPDSRFTVGVAFAVGGGDSETSEDRGSRSPTAASGPKAKYGPPVMVGAARDKNRAKSLNGKMIGSQAHRNQQVKGRIESTKKARGERVNVEKSNSHSSMESDSRSSNFLFMQGASSVNSNGKQSGQSVNYDGADSRQVNASGEKTGHGEENLGEFGDLSHGDLSAGLSWNKESMKSENHQMEQEPLVNSILSLQMVQEALEKEIQKFGEVGNDLKLVLDYPSNDNGKSADFASTKIEAQVLSSYNENGSAINTQNMSTSLQTKVISLTGEAKLLESKLEEVKNMLQAKESRIAELEATLNLSRSPKEQCGSTMDQQQEKYNEFETELEGFFRQRIEAEVEYLTIVKTIQNVKIIAADNEKTREQDGTDKLEEAKEKAVELEKSCQDITETEEFMKLQRKVCKATSWFLIQLILLFLVIWFFALQLKPHYGAFVPT